MDADRHPRDRHQVRRIRRRFLHRGPYLDVDADVRVAYQDGSPVLPADEDIARAAYAQRRDPAVGAPDAGGDDGGR